MHSQQQPPFEEGRIQFGHYDHLDNFADPQKVAQIQSETEALVDQYATVSLPPKIQRPVCTLLKTLSDSAMANRSTSIHNHNFHPRSQRVNPPHRTFELELSEGKGGRKRYDLDDCYNCDQFYSRRFGFWKPSFRWDSHLVGIMAPAIVNSTSVYGRDF
jgi:hypothetical protein